MFFDRQLKKVHQFAVSDSVSQWVVVIVGSALRLWLHVCLGCELASQSRWCSGSRQLLFHSQSVVKCLWHPKLNQIMVGCADGKAKVLFSPKHSVRYNTLTQPHS